MPPSLDHDDDTLLRDIFTRVRTIAVVGASANPTRPSFGVAQDLCRRGYTVFGVNPGLAANAIPGITTVATLADLPAPVDMVDVFRNVALIEGVVDEVLAMRPLPAVLWMQLGIRHDAAAARAQAAGMIVVMDRCPRIEIPRLFGGA